MEPEQIMVEPPRTKAFCYTEISNNTIALESWSVGRSIYFEGTPGAELYDVCFSVCKNYDTTALEITVRGPKLIQWLREVILWDSPDPKEGQSELTIDYLHLLPIYPVLRSRLIEKETRKFLNSGVVDEEIIELQLFVRDFLLERSIFESFGFEDLYEHTILTAVHWQDIQYRSIQKDIDDLDECVDLVSESEANHGKPPLQRTRSVRRKLRRAIRRHDLQAVISILTQNPGHIDATTLTTAIEFYHSPIFSLLIDHGARINRDKFHIDAEPLFIAAKGGNVDAVKVLLQHGARIEGCSTSYCIPPLTGAASGGHFDIVQYLVENGANVHGNGYCHQPPLSCAAENGHIDVVDYLVRHGADVNVSSEDHSSPLSLAAKKGHINVVDCLVRHGANVNRTGYCYQPPLSCATENGHIDVVDYLVRHGADVNGNGYCYQCPMSRTTKKGRINVINYRFQCRDDINSSSKSHLPPLFYAAENGHIDVVDYLVRHGANVNRTGYCHQHPLSCAQEKSYIDVVDYLVRHGANVNDTGYCYQPPLTCAAENGHIDVVDYLFQRGAIVSPDETGIEVETCVLRNCPTIAAIQARERHTIGRQLVAKISKSHSQLMDKVISPPISADFTFFVEQLGTCRSIWKKGVRVMRNLTNGHLPSQISDIISCLQVADAMRSTALNPALVCSEQEFVNDLRRWASLVQSTERPLFTEIASCLWGKSWNHGEAESDQFCFDEMLQYFQELVSNLVSQHKPVDSVAMSSSLGGFRLQYLQQLHSPTAVCSPQKCNKVSPTVEPRPPDKLEVWQEKCDRDALRAQNSEMYLATLGRITVLMAGAIFGVILVYLCLIRFGSSALCLSFITSPEGQSSSSNKFLVWNCKILMLYLGLSTAHLASHGWKAASNESSNPLSNGGECIRTHQSLFPNNRDNLPNASHDILSPESEGFAMQAMFTTSALTCPVTPSNSMDLYAPVEPVNDTNPPDPESTITPLQPTQTQCPKCNKSFSSVKNRNKHIRYDCKYGATEQFPCRNAGCRRGSQHPFTRKSYRDTHERERCRTRQNVRRFRQLGTNAPVT